MTQVTFNLTDESKLTAILEWLQKQPMVFDIRTAPKKLEPKGAPMQAKKPALTPKQKRMAEDLQEALQDVELHQQGKKKLKTAEELIAEIQAL